MGSDNHGPQVEAVAIIFVTISWIAIGLRCYVRMFITKLFRADDWLAVLTMVAFSFYCSFVIAGAARGTGRHNVSEEDFAVSMKWWFCGEITYGITTCLMKVSVGVFLLQICVHPTQRKIIWTVIISFSLFTAYYVPLMVYQCHPVQNFWDKSVNGWCLPTNIIANSTYAHGALTAVADWTLGTVPIFLVWSLQMNIRTKVSAALLLALGSIGSTATIIRIPYISQLANYSDFLYDNTSLSIWSTVEAGIGITASSLACLRPLFQAFFSRSRLTGSSTHETRFRNTSRIASGPRESNGAEIIGLRENLAKNILVTTVIDSRSARDSRDVEMGGVPGLVRNESLRGLASMNAWNVRKKRSVDESSDDISLAPAYEGVEVICRSGSR